ncbi:YitT family protein [Hutsoniella sourekii]
MNNKSLSIFKNLLLIFIGSVLLALSVAMIILPNGLGEGGVTGITALVYYLFQIPPGWTNLFINGVIMAVGWKFLDKVTIAYTLVSIVIVTICLNWVPMPVFIPDNKLVAAIAAGVLLGAGVGITLLGKGTTAGVDIIALIINKYFGVPISMALLIIDMCIVMTLFFVIGPELWVMTLILIYVTSQVINFIIEGLNPKKQLFIVSSAYQEIADRVQIELDRGITGLYGYGHFSKKDKHILYIVVDTRQLLKAQRLIHDIDPSAFVTISSVQQVLGEGFTFFLEDN